MAMKIICSSAGSSRVDIDLTHALIFDAKNIYFGVDLATSTYRFYSTKHNYNWDL